MYITFFLLSLNMKILFPCLFLLSSLLACNADGQVGMTVSPSKLYFKLTPGATNTQKITVVNPNNSELDVGVSISDWGYDATGNNILYDMATLKNSCAEWFRVLPGSVFTLQPNERRDLEVVFAVPRDADQSVPVHTAMLFLTQMNPGDARAQNGAAIKVSVRIGVKIYHSFVQSENRNLEVVELKDTTIVPENKGAVAAAATPIHLLELQVQNTGKIWMEGKVKWELLDTQTGVKTKMEEQDFYTLPGDTRTIRQSLPDNLKKGNYTATAVINYGNKDEIKVVELEFKH